MSAKRKESHQGGIDEHARAKLDGGLRYLLSLPDEEIAREVEARRTALASERERAAEAARSLLEMSSPHEREPILKAQESSLSRMLPHPIFGPVIVDTESIEPVRIRAMVEFTGNTGDLESLGLTVGAQAHDVFTVVGTPKQLAELASQPATRRMRIPRLMMPTVENATAQSEVSALHDKSKGEYKGSGVMVGIVDLGLDVTHNAFRDPAAGAHPSRVLYYWVQSPHVQSCLPILGPGGKKVGEICEYKPATNPPGQTPEAYHKANTAGTPNFTGLDYGRIYTNKAINTAISQTTVYGDGANQICYEPGTSSHGTHVAGIAAGSGHEANWNTKPTHVGAAPLATMVHVCYSDEPGATLDAVFEDRLADGIDFILRAAEHEKMPVVINASLGTSLGPHNGSSLLDKFCDNKLNSYPNRSIVIAGGNGDDDYGFRRGTIQKGGSVTLQTSPQQKSGWLDIWNRGPKLQCELKHGGKTSGLIDINDDYKGTIDGMNIQVARHADSGGGMHNVRIYFETSKTPPWDVKLTNPDPAAAADYFAWAGPQLKFGSVVGWTQGEFTICDNACCKSVFTVGACGKVLPNPDPKKGEVVTAYSGAGPTTDGRIKPEIVAIGGTSGAQIQSAKSDQKSDYRGGNGTSMAAPLVAGAIAQLLEKWCVKEKKNLFQDTVKGLLAATANRTGLHLDPSDPKHDPKQRRKYGHGRLRMIAPTLATLPLKDADVWIRTAGDDYGAEPYLGGCFCRSPDITVREKGTGKVVSELSWGKTYDVTVTVRNLGWKDAANTKISLRYSLPHASPTAWHPAKDKQGAFEQTKTIPAFGKLDVAFEWVPVKPAGAPANAKHFCLLAEADLPVKDPLSYKATAGGSDPWRLNIKGTNNIALRNVCIQ